MEILLNCQNIVKDFGGVRALNRTTFQVYEGDILGLVGPNGSGKTTMINVISGQYRADSGILNFKNHDIRKEKPDRLAHLGIARTYQIPRPFTSLLVSENVALAYMFGRKYHNKEQSLQLAEQTLDLVGLSHKSSLPVTKLNLHERKFLELARALALEPKLLLLDEVLAGLNPTEVDIGINLIKRIHASGVTLVFVEHNLRAVTKLSTRMVVLNYGQKISEGTPQEVINDVKVINAYLGQDYVES